MAKVSGDARCKSCTRISLRDLNRGYCPVTAALIHGERPADRCIFYTDGRYKRPEGKYKEEESDDQ